MALNFDFISITTADLPASLAFYRTLGLDLADELDDAPHVEHVLPNGMKLAWDPVSSIQKFLPKYQLPTGDNRITFAFNAGTPAEVDRTYAEVVAKHPAAAHKAPWDAPWGQRYSTVLDPEGNSIDIYAPQTDSAD